MSDLFAAIPAPRHEPKLPTGFAALQPSGRFEKHGAASLFVHHCAKCGDVNAPFGFLCHLGAAMDSRDARKAGIWLCGECRDEVLAEEDMKGSAT